MVTQGNGSNLVIQGRLVWGKGSSLFEGQHKTDFNTKQPLFGADGQPSMEYGFGLAIPKIDPGTGQPTAEYTKVWQALHTEAFTLYPSGQLPPTFAMKMKDGDEIDHNGKPFAEREGYAGHTILACTTMIPIKYFTFENGNNILVNTGIKVGDYVEVSINVKAHPAKGQGKPGLYLNPSAVRLIQPGMEIINSPSGDQIFGNDQPAGYNGTIVADTAPQMTPAMQQPGMAPQMPVAPAAPQMAPPVPAAPPAPHYGVLPPNHQPQPQMPAQQQPGMAPQMPVAPVLPNTMVPQHQPAVNPMMPAVAPPVQPGMPQLPAGNVFPAQHGITPQMPMQ